MARKDVVYIHSDDFLFGCEHPTKLAGRALMVHKLIEACGILRHVRVEQPLAACAEDLGMFHSKEYISCAKKMEDIFAEQHASIEVDSGEFEEASTEDYGLAYDCQPFKAVFGYICFLAGAALKSAEMLNLKDAITVINLYGGWHHAHRDSAAGFCYVNDIVLAILKLKEKHKRVLYIDLDIHHGDGVEEAFSTTDKVMTVSFHKYDKGYFPGTGSLQDVGNGNGKYYSVNVPLKEGIGDVQYYSIFTRIIDKVKDVFAPDAVVCQCGADCLSGDPLGGFNLTNQGLTQCVKYVSNWNLPLLILGGGGYNFANTARAWAYLTASILNEDIGKDIPEHEFFAEYSPVFDMNITPSVRRSCNSKEYIDEVIKTVSENLSKISRNPLKSIQLACNGVTLKRGTETRDRAEMASRRSKRNKRLLTGKHELSDENQTELNDRRSCEADRHRSVTRMQGRQTSPLRTNARDSITRETDYVSKKRNSLVNKLFEFDENS